LISPVQDIKGKVIFLSPLDWGMGHASRCVPIIESLYEHNTVILGISNLNAVFFDLHFPQLQKVHMPSYGIRYSKHLPAFFKLLLQAPRLVTVIKKEQALLERLIKEHAIDLVISDSRFGCYSKQVKSVFITHQLKVQAPYFSGIANAINRKWIGRFTEVWVPDFENAEHRLSGRLSDASKTIPPVFFIGPQSALQKHKALDTTKPIDTLILLSGVEPQRTVLEENLLNALGANSKRIVLVRGSEKKMEVLPKGVEVYTLAYGKTLAELIANSERVICRSGYSTLMDLHGFGKKNLILIPTPGQSEQEYLAQHWAQNFNAIVYRQQELEKATL
jgi:predicted glycosyltransferase